MEGYNQVQTKISDWTVGKSTIEKEDLTKEVSDEIKKWDSGAGGAAEAIVAVSIHMDARRVNPESIKGWKLDLRRLTSDKRLEVAF